jgi:hypothetical protein
MVDAYRGKNGLFGCLFLVLIEQNWCTFSKIIDAYTQSWPLSNGYRPTVLLVLLVLLVHHEVVRRRCMFVNARPTSQIHSQCIFRNSQCMYNI